jgi:CBS domain-containing protein
MKVGDVMTRGVITLAPDTPLRKAAQLMLQYDLTGFPVVQQGKLVGVITEGDLMRRVECGTGGPSAVEALAEPGLLAEAYTHSHGRSVADVMSRQLITASTETSLEEAVRLMERYHVKRLPVVNEDNGVVGVLSRANLLHVFIVASPQEAGAAQDDAAIREQLERELADHRWLQGASISIAVKDGVVELRGTIADERQRTALRVAAENIGGVRGVADQVTCVGPAQ